MGEYITLNGDQAKLGTCEDLYYTRYEQLAEAVTSGKARQDGGNLAPAEYLTHEAGFRFRFPFPDEDGKHEIGDYPNAERGLVIALPAGHPALFAPENHRTLCHTVQATGGGYQVNVFIPCPAGRFPEGSGIRTSPIGDRLPIEIVQQRPMPDGSLWTVCRCAWCHAAYRLPPEEALALTEYIAGDYLALESSPGTRHYWAEVARRIAAGYHRRMEPAAAPPLPAPPAGPGPAPGRPCYCDSLPGSRCDFCTGLAAPDGPRAQAWRQEQNAPAPAAPAKPEPARHYDRNEAIAVIRAALKRRSGKAWSVTGNRGTAWGWIDISAPPARRTGEFGTMTEADRAELAALLGLERSAHCQGVSVAPDSRAWYVRQAEGPQE